MSQKSKVLNHLKRYGSITPQYAYVKLGIYRLAARISELRGQGVKIVTDQNQGKCATYRLVA